MVSTYVIGHVNPDMDSIASAVGYAWLMRERDGTEVLAARAGGVNAQTTWVLNYLGLDAPLLMTDASPRFESVMRRLYTTMPDQPLRDAWAIANPIFPDERFETKRTGSITSTVGPAVTKACLPVKLLC